MAAAPANPPQPAATAAAAENAEWRIKESRTHPNTFYRFNARTGESEWLTPQTLAENKRAAAQPKEAAVAAKVQRPVSAPATRPSADEQGSFVDSGMHPVFVHGKHRRPGTASTLRREKVPIHVHLPDKNKRWVRSKTDIANEVSAKMGEPVASSELSFGSDDKPDNASVSTQSFVCDCECEVYEPVPFEGNSRYREDYPKHPLRPQNRDRPQRSVTTLPSDPDQFTTKYLEDFKPFRPDPPGSMKPQYFSPQHVPFDGTTTHKASYYPKPLNNANARRPPSPARPSAPFEGTTTQRTAHIPFTEARPRESMAPKQPNKLHTAPFEGTTQYKKDYVPLPLENSRKKNLPADGWSYGPPREFPTEHRDQYTPKKNAREKKNTKCNCRKAHVNHDHTMLRSLPPKH